MSADNGIYILKTPKYRIKKGNTSYRNDGYDYRVAHAQAIDNIDYSDLYIPLYFANSPVFDNEIAAWKYAEELAKDYEFLEYGISLIEKDIYPNMTASAAWKALDCYMGVEPLDYVEKD